MTGKKLKALRQALNIELPWFASLLGMHVAKLARWEESAELSLHPMQASVVAILELQVRLLGARAPVLGKRIITGMMLYGPPYGLLVALHAHFEGMTFEFVSAAVSEQGKPPEPV